MIWINNLDHFKYIEAWIKHFADDTFNDIFSKDFCLIRSNWQNLSIGLGNVLSTEQVTSHYL